MSNNSEERRVGDLDDDMDEDEEDGEVGPPRETAQQGIAGAGIDLNALAEKVYQRLRREVLIERERRTGRISG